MNSKFRRRRRRRRRRERIHNFLIGTQGKKRHSNPTYSHSLMYRREREKERKST
jgi:hypothetical protein